MKSTVGMGILKLWRTGPNLSFAQLETHRRITEWRDILYFKRSEDHDLEVAAKLQYRKGECKLGVSTASAENDTGSKQNCGA